MTRFFLCALTMALYLARPSFATDVQVSGGRTSVALDSFVLDSLGLSISGTTDDVVVPGSLPDSVGFSINSRDAVSPALPTTFAYNSTDFANTFSGTLEHAGSVFFTDADGDQTETGNYTIGFDANRIVGDTSGFFVKSNAGLVGTLFDLEAPSVLEARPDGLTAEARLLISPELAAVLGSGNLSGITIGSARIEAVPEPASLVLALVGSGLAWGMSRRVRRGQKS